MPSSLTWLLSLAAFLAISMSGRPSILNPWLPSLRCLALYSTCTRENQNGQCGHGGTHPVLFHSSHWVPGTFSGCSYLTGLFGCLSGLLDVWPISNCGVMQILFGIFFISNLIWGKEMFEVHRILKRPHSIQTSFVLSKSKPVCTTVLLNPLAREITRARTCTHLGSTGMPKGNLHRSASWPLPWHASPLGALA